MCLFLGDSLRWLGILWKWWHLHRFGETQSVLAGSCTHLVHLRCWIICKRSKQVFLRWALENVPTSNGWNKHDSATTFTSLHICFIYWVASFPLSNSALLFVFLFLVYGYYFQQLKSRIWNCTNVSVFKPLFVCPLKYHFVKYKTNIEREPRLVLIILVSNSIFQNYSLI